MLRLSPKMVGNSDDEANFRQVENLRQALAK